MDTYKPAMTSAFTDAARMWNQRYDQPDYLFGRAPNAYLHSKAALLPASGRALCVADGEGRNSVWLAGQGLAVEAFDVSDVAVRKAQALAQEAGVAVDFHVCDGEVWDWSPDRHDVVAAIFIQFADPAMRERLFANMVRTLRPGGLLVLQGYTPRQLEFKTGGPGQLSHLYTADLIRSSFSSLETVELVEYEASLSEGSQHAGLSALLGYVGRKA
jgi:SAM-dependent methyltransferase